MNDEELQRVLITEHEKEAARVGATIYNLGWAMTQYGIASKTSNGVLESTIDPQTLTVTQIWS